MVAIKLLCAKQRCTSHIARAGVVSLTAENHASVKNMKQTKGFTLIELMITVAIVAILAAIALPSYQSHIRKARRVEAQAYLMDLAQRQQQYFTDNRSYATTIDAAGLNAAVPSSVSTYYTLVLPIASGTIAVPGQTSPPAFTITATAIDTQIVDGDLKIDSTGARSPADKW